MSRLYYLDNLRILCFVIGVFLHASHLPGLERLNWIAGMSSMFRMPVFFAISGYFSGLILDRRGVADFLGTRLWLILVPFFSALILLNPPTLALIYDVFNGAQSPGFGYRDILAAVAGRTAAEGPMIWHLHLWFLISLAVYTALTPLLRRSLRRGIMSGVSDTLGRAPDWLWPSLFALLMATGLTLVKIGLYALGKLGIGMPWLIGTTVFNLPFFLLGLYAHTRGGFSALTWRSGLLLAAIAFLARQAQSALGGGGPDADALVHPFILHNVTGPFAGVLVRHALSVLVILLSLRLLDFSSRPTRFLSEAIYTVYIWHYLVIYLLAAALVAMGMRSFGLAAYGGIVLATLGLTIMLHHHVIKKIPILNLMFCGKPLAHGQAKRADV